MNDFIDFFKLYYQCLLHIWKIIFGLIILIISGAYIFSYLENISFGKALYFSFITSFAIGYGDIVPETLAGKIISILLGGIGLILLGIIIGISTRSITLIMHPKEFKNH